MNEKEKSEQKLGQSQNVSQFAHSNSELSCSICKISFANHQILAEHLTSHQIGLVTEPQSQSNFTNQKKIFLCSKCNQQFSSKESCLVHVKICKGCPKVNNMTEKNLQKDKKFACIECNKTFGFQSSLANYTLVAHKKAEKCSCPKCGGAFSNQMNLDQHLRFCEASEINVEKLC